MRYPAVRAKYEPITSLLRDALEKFWPEPTPLDLDRLLNEGPTLRVLFYGIDDLPEREQRPAWEQIQELIADYPQHEYVLATDEPYVKLHQVRIGKLELHLLVVQPLSQRKIRYLLDEMARNDPSIPMLVSKMDQAQLFDLAQTPWFLVRMIRRANAGDYPDSRTEVLQRLVEDAVAKIPAEQGMRAHAEETIYAIAWEMQSARRTTWPVSTAFETMAAVRGSREYNLEAFYKELTDTILLNRVGEDYLRFNYLPIQAYCCAKAILAMPDRDVVLDDITATLGRITRLRWWEETMVFLSGLMCDERDELKKLLHKIVYGVNILEGEQTFLAARCLLESQHAGQEDDLDLVGQVTDALIWRLNRENEPRITHRVRAARLLGQLIYPLACRTSDPDCEEPIQNKEQRDEICSAVVDNLTKVANQRARRDSSGNPDYYYSSLRLAAAMALQHLYPKLEREVEDIDPRLDEVLHLWQEKKVDELVEEVRSGNEETQAIAVLAVGDMYDQAVMGKDRKRRRLIIDCLVEVFLDPDTEQVVRWAVADALSIIDSEVVNRRVIRSILSEQAEAKFDPEQRIHLYKCLAYLIGRIRTQDGRAHRFLRETCLGEHADVRLWASAIRALGELSDPQHRPLLEQIALGEFQDVELSEACRVNLEDGLSHAYERTLLRRRAIEALSNVGDEQTLQKLRAGKTDLDLELWRSFYLTSEEIYWRMSQGLGSVR
jgi:HEAT repeat protein